MNSKKTAIIIGAGPAGLTAALELQRRTDITPLLLEADHCVGGISRTVNYKGNRMDIGGHRFFSKSRTVMDWWLEILALEESELQIPGYTVSPATRRARPDEHDDVMLIRSRLSRIYYLRKFFDYPISLNWNTVSGMGLTRMALAGMSYLRSSALPIKNEQSLEDFFINRFGRRLYLTFFKDYTEKVWGISCDKIGADWGAQRIKGVSIRKALAHALKQLINKGNVKSSDAVETSLINRFLYPKYGPGQLWEKVRDMVAAQGGIIHMNEKVTGIVMDGHRVLGVTTTDSDGTRHSYDADYVFSTMPVKDLISEMTPSAPTDVRRVADGLMYRDFITVGLLLTKMKGDTPLVRDNWIYIQEPDVKLGRLQIFNNWSPYMVANKQHVWIGLEYFCNEGDELWQMNDDAFSKFAVKELEKINLIDANDVLDAVTIKLPKTYPGYFGTYNEFHVIEEYVNRIENLFLVGRNGMHRYNNQDHSMLSAITAVQNIVEGRTDKSNIWAVNTEQDYHEEK